MNASHNLSRLSIAFVLAAGLASCTVGPEYRPPRAAPPEAWIEPNAMTGEPAPEWWKSFKDPELDALVVRATTANTDLRVAIGRLREARARRGVVAGALYPQVDATGSYSNSHFSENGFLKGLGGGGSGSPPGAIVPGQEINLYEAGIDASWEVDLFGGTRRALQAADADFEAAAFDAGDALVAVVAEAADGYLQVRGLQTRLALARQTAESRAQSVEALREQAQAGVADELDLARAENQAAEAQARVPDLESAVQVAIRRLEVLTGARPGTLDAELTPAAPLPTPPQALAVGIPSDLLRRRPDVRAAERHIAAATARIGVATADLFPKFSLTGSFGLQSQEFGDLPAGDSRFWAVGPAVRWPILDFGRIRSNIAVQNARQEQAAAAYEGVVLQALSDVEVALVRLAREERRLDHLVAASEAASRAASIADEQYRSGVLDYLDLLDAQRTEFASADSVAQSRAAVAEDVVSLYRALGGGWEGGAVDPGAFGLDHATSQAGAFGS
ncbi:MAG: efflux transporter outer membrane subunit [Phycisphaerales bacterium]|nr:efflux transporter outer membrane subunit [Phycisphaerales bacterium]